MHKFKLIIGTINNDNSWSTKNVDKPVYFTTKKEAKEYLLKRKEELDKINMRIWFYRLWEFGKEDYIDLGENALGIINK